MKKLIFMLLSPIWVIVEDFKEKFEYLLHKTWPWTCDRIGFKFYKKQMNSKNHDICHDIICGGCDKKLRRFCKSYEVCWLRNEVSPKKFQRVQKDSLSFWVKVTIELRFDIKTFCIGKSHDGLFHVKFWLIFESIS